MSDALAVPPGARLVHIGFDKTGTTALQGAFHDDRDRLRANGVVYPGTERYHKRAGIAVTEARGNTGDDPVTMADWQALVREVREARDARVFVSSEWLCRATEAQARRVVRGLGGRRVHVVATVRPLAKILPSAWQQYVKDGFTGRYDDWLRGMLLEPPYQQPTPWFWIRHRHDVVLARWAALVGPSRVTAVVVDERDPGLLLRQFEALLALPDGFLVAKPTGKRNASLTWPEVEMLRRVNAEFRERGWPDELYGATVRSGLIPRLADARPDSGLDPIRTPRWALERAAEVGAEVAVAIGALGITVLGDLDSLGRPPRADESEAVEADPAVDIATAAQAVTGVLVGAARQRRRATSAAAPAPTSLRWRRGRRVAELPEF